jgi:hypothetical protein
MTSTLEQDQHLEPKLSGTESRVCLDLSTLEEGIVQGLAKLKSDLIKWMFFFSMSLVIVMTGIIFTLLKTIK